MVLIGESSPNLLTSVNDYNLPRIMVSTINRTTTSKWFIFQHAMFDYWRVGVSRGESFHKESKVLHPCYKCYEGDGPGCGEHMTPGVVLNADAPLVGQLDTVFA